MSPHEEPRQAKIDALLDRAARLHSAPAVALRIVELTRDPDFDLAELVSCLEHDPPLAAAILRLVNSSQFGLAHHVGSLQQAVALLGRRALRLTAISFGIVKSLTRDTPAELYATYWRRSLTMSCAARLCAVRTTVDADEAYTAGLLADLGTLALAQVHRDLYPPLAVLSRPGSELVEEERALFGFDHTEVTACLLARWSLPPRLADATANHHSVLDSESQLTNLVRLANLLAEVLWTPNSPHMPVLLQLLDEQLNLSVDDLIEMALQCKERVHESAEIFKVRLSGEIDLDALEQEARRQFESAAFDATLDLDCMENVFEGLSPD